MLGAATGRLRNRSTNAAALHRLTQNLYIVESLALIRLTSLLITKTTAAGTIQLWWELKNINLALYHLNTSVILSGN